MMLGSLIAPAVMADTPLWARMISPKYRNAIYPTMDAPVSVKIRTKVADSELAGSRIDITLSRNGNNIKTWQFTNLSSENVLDLPVSDVTFVNTRSGPYTKDDNPYLFTLELKRDSTLLDTESLVLNKYPSPPAGVDEVRIDDNDNFVINGQPTFIYGAYISGYRNNTEDYKYLESLGFDTFLEKTTTLGRNPSTRALLYTIGSISAVQNNRQNPQLLAYHLYDEPNMKDYDPYQPATCKAAYQGYVLEDPYHPALNVATMISTTKDYPITDYYGCEDMIMLDPYPIRISGYQDIGTIYKNYEMLDDMTYSAFEHKDIPAAAVPPLFSSSTVYRYPENQESKNMVYQHIAGGSKAIFPYTYDSPNSSWDYYGNTIIPEIKLLEGAILAPLASNPVSVTSTDPTRIVVAHKQTADRDYIFLINTTSFWNRDTKDRVIDIDITFHEPGSDTVEAVVRDSGTPQNYAVVNNRVSLSLDGVNSTSTGVVVLMRDRQVSTSPTPPPTTPAPTTPAPTPPSTPTGLREAPSSN